MDPLLEAISERSSRMSGGDTVWFVELNGGRVIEPTAFEPDAATYRGEFYYNAVSNELYKRVQRIDNGVKTAFWQRVSQ